MEKKEDVICEGWLHVKCGSVDGLTKRRQADRTTGQTTGQCGRLVVRPVVQYQYRPKCCSI